MGLVICKLCNNTVPAARFCGRCGGSLEFATPLPVSKPSGIDMTNPKHLLVGGLALVFALGLFAALFGDRPSSSVAPSKSEPKAVASSSQPSPSVTSSSSPPPLAPTPPPKPDPVKLREELKEQLRYFVQGNNTHLNYIEGKVTKVKGGYALWAVHDFFSQYSFAAGDDARQVSTWMNEHNKELKDAQIVKVGYMGKGPYSSWCWLEFK